MNQTKNARNLRRSLFALFVIFLALGITLSCSIFAEPTPTPTSTLTPTNSTAPTFTLRPTVNRAATNAANQRQTDSAETEIVGQFLGYIDQKLSEVGEMMSYGTVLYVNADPIVVESTKHGQWSYQLLDSYDVGTDFAFHTIVKWEMLQRIGIVDCGLMFRMGEDISLDPFYMLWMGKISGIPHMWFETIEYYTIKGASNYFINAAIDDNNGAENELILTARGTQFTVYVNKRQVGVWWNSRASTGNFGLAAMQDTGSSRCTFSDTWIWGWQ
jgi:hypothetical protein